MHYLSVADFDKQQTLDIINSAVRIKKSPKRYEHALHNKSLLTVYETTSLRTRLSFEAAMTQLGGHAINYHLRESTLGRKETPKEFVGSATRYVDGVTARVFDHSLLEQMAKFSGVPVINAMTNQEHPCQLLGDLVTIGEKFGKLKGLRLAYFGDGFNNVTNSLLLGCATVGINVVVACPRGKDYEPDNILIKNARSLASGNGSTVTVLHSAKKAARKADIVYTDSWMSYRIPDSREKMRISKFKPFQVNGAVMKTANKDAIFMHCLPAKRGHEVTNDVIDSRQSVVFDQAENRLHAQKALLINLLG